MMNDGGAHWALAKIVASDPEMPHDRLLALTALADAIEALNASFEECQQCLDQMRAEGYDEAIIKEWDCLEHPYVLLGKLIDQRRDAEEDASDSDNGE